MKHNEFTLQTLLKEQNLHVLIIGNGETKIVFTKSHNIGYIENKTLFVHPDFMPGGKFNNVIIDQELELVKSTYKLIEITTEQTVTIAQNNLKELQDIKQKISVEKDLTTANALAERAENIAFELQTKESAVLNEDIQQLLFDIVNPAPVVVVPVPVAVVVTKKPAPKKEVAAPGKKVVGVPAKKGKK